MLTHLSLFTGFAGIDIAAEIAGWTTVGQCEKAEYPYELLCKRAPYIPKWRDIQDVTAKSFHEKTGYRTVKLITGGYPCQPESTAGKRKGKEDDRWLWPEMFRIVKELKPTWVLGENVAGHISMGLETVCSDLESEGYEVRPFVIPACAVGAKHRRDRVFTVGYSECKGRTWSDNIQEPAEFTQSGETVADTESDDKGRLPVRTQSAYSGFRSGCETMAYASSTRQQKFNASKFTEGEGSYTGSIVKDWGKGKPEPGLGGMFNGIPDWLEQLGMPAAMGEPQYTWEPPRTIRGAKKRTQRIKGLGNAVFPWQVYPILQAIADIENGRR